MTSVYSRRNQVDYRNSKHLRPVPDDCLEAFELDSDVGKPLRPGYVWTLEEAEAWFKSLTPREQHYARYRRVAVLIFPDGGVRRVNFFKLPLALPLEGTRAKQALGDTDENT